LEVVALDSEDVLASHKKVIDDLRAAVLQMSTWTSVFCLRAGRRYVL
jgi:hypothetical protein